MEKIEVSFIDSERKFVFKEVNALGYDFEYSPYSNNTIIISDISLVDKDKFICFLNEHDISWNN